MARRIIDMRTVERVPSHLERYQRIFMQEAYRGLREVEPQALATIRAAVAAAPSTGIASNPVRRGRRSSRRAGSMPDLVQVNNGAIATGKYRDDWRAKRRSMAAGSIGILVYNTKAYAPNIEYGRRSGRMPPVSAIRKWLQVKFSLPYRRAKRIAWPIAAAIKRRGIPGRKIMTAPQTEMTFRFYMEETAVKAQTRALRRAFR